MTTLGFPDRDRSKREKDMLLVNLFIEQEITSMNNTRLSSNAVKEFLFDQTIDCFHPDSGDRAATIEYLANGICRVVMENGVTDEGRYGFKDDLYWTQYSWFRDGGFFRFFLVRVDDNTCQAYFEDGAIAFLQKTSFPRSAKGRS